MALGSAAGVAAKQLVDGHAPTVQDVDVNTVQGILVPPPTAWRLRLQTLFCNHAWL